MRFSLRRVKQNMPYATSALPKICEKCQTKACVQSCPEKVIVLNPDKIPTLEFDRSGCTFCQECVKACFQANGEHLGFDLSLLQTQVKMSIDPCQCLAWNHSICYSCKDVCPKKIQFVGMFYPEILECNGCGLCIARCPTMAIQIKGER